LKVRGGEATRKREDVGVGIERKEVRKTMVGLEAHKKAVTARRASFEAVKGAEVDVVKDKSAGESNRKTEMKGQSVV
jgi:hypothetical protein